MGVDHRRLYVLVPKQFLDVLDVVTVLEQVRRRKKLRWRDGGIVSNRGGSGRGEGPGFGEGTVEVGRDTAPWGRVCDRGSSVACRAGRGACASFVV